MDPAAARRPLDRRRRRIRVVEEEQSRGVDVACDAERDAERRRTAAYPDASATAAAGRDARRSYRSSARRRSGAGSRRRGCSGTERRRYEEAEPTEDAAAKAAEIDGLRRHADLSPVEDG